MQKLFISIGSGPGIGLSTAVRFAREGFTPVLASRDTAKLEVLADEVRKASGQEAIIYRLDAGDSQQVAALAEQYGQNAAVVHYNAAVLRPQPLSEMSFDSMSNDIQVGLTNALAAVKAFSPAMMEKKQGTILLTGGGLALAPMEEFLTLSITKAGIRCLSQGLFEKLAEHNVHIASLTVAKQVDEAEDDPAKIAEIFWGIHAQPRDTWTWEERYE